MINDLKSFNEISHLFDEFYIIDEPQKIPVKETEKNKKSLSFLGGNKSRILFVYDGEGDLQNADKEMINNLVVNAIKISWDDIALLNLRQNENPEWEAVKKTLQPAKIIFWGVNAYAGQAGFTNAEYMVGNLDAAMAITVHPISEFHTNKELKLKLWTAIQQLLSLK